MVEAEKMVKELQAQNQALMKENRRSKRSSYRNTKV